MAKPARHIDAYNRIVNTWLPATIPPILWLNTAVLLLSTVTMEIARRHMFHEIDAMEEWFGLGKPTSRRALPWLIATLVLGSLFLAGQIARLASARATASLLQLQRQRRSRLLHHHLRPRRPSHRRNRCASSPPSSASSPSAASRTARSWSTAPPGTGTPWASSGSSSSPCSSSSSDPYASVASLATDRTAKSIRHALRPLRLGSPA